MAELQAIAAAGDVVKLALSAGIFLRRVAHADQIAIEVNERISRLETILDSTCRILDARRNRRVEGDEEDGADQQVADDVLDCIKACRILLEDLGSKVGGEDGFNTTESRATLVNRFRLACRHSGIQKLQTGLEARVSALQTDLSLLQLSDQARTQRTMRQNHEGLVDNLDTFHQKLEKLSQQIEQGHKLVQRMLDAGVGVTGFDNLRGDVLGDVDRHTIKSLAHSMRMAEDLYEEYTTEYAPDARSELFHRDAIREEHSEPNTPPSEQDVPQAQWSDGEAGPSIESVGIAEDESRRKRAWPLLHLNDWIESARNQATTEQAQGHYNTAEKHLYSAIKYSEMRQKHYDVPFADAVQLQEQVAQLYQQQGKYGEALAHVHGLLREEQSNSAQARQNQLLAEIYLEKYRSRPDRRPIYSSDIENAETHVREAFSARHELIEAGNANDDEVERHRTCTALLINIFEARGNTLEASRLTRTQTAFSTARRSVASFDSESMRSRPSIAIPISRQGESDNFVVVEDRQQLLGNALRSGDFTSVLELLAAGDEVEVNQLDSRGRSLLWYAIEKNNETIVHKLLDPTVGADVGLRHKNGLTVLHHAAALGQEDMVRCLIKHDADIKARDKRMETPLLKAVQKDRLEVLKILYDSNADVHARDFDGWSALHFSIRLSSTAMTIRLLETAPELGEAVDAVGQTALHHCAEMELFDQMKALLEHRPHLEVDAPDSHQRTPLCIIADKAYNPHRDRLVALLVKHGVQIDGSKRLPAKWTDYPALKQFRVPKRSSNSRNVDMTIRRHDSSSTANSDMIISRHDSVSTENTVGTTTTDQTTVSSVLSRLKPKRKTVRDKS